MKPLLCISRRAPYQGAHAREALDVLLAAAAFDCPARLLFMGDGVLQLLKNQQPDTAHYKNLGKNLTALEVFGVEEIYVHEPSLLERGLNREDLLLTSVQLVNNNTAAELLARPQHLLSF